jgi:hypothetical protein
VASLALRARLKELDAKKAMLRGRLIDINDEIETEDRRLVDVASDYEEATSAFARYDEAQKGQVAEEVYATRMRLLQVKRQPGP